MVRVSLLLTFCSTMKSIKSVAQSKYVHFLSLTLSPSNITNSSLHMVNISTWITPWP